MSRSAVLDKSSKSRDDLDAFVDECIDSKDEKDLKIFQKTAQEIMCDSKRRQTKASASAAHEKARSV